MLFQHHLDLRRGLALGIVAILIATSAGILGVDHPRVPSMPSGADGTPASSKTETGAPPQLSHPRGSDVSPLAPPFCTGPCALGNLSSGIGSGTDSVVYDPSDGNVFVANWFSSYVSIISTATDTVVGEIYDNTSNSGQVYDPTTSELFVGGQSISNGANVVLVVSTASDRVLAQVPVGSYPVCDMAFDSALGEIFAPNGRSDTLNVISDASNTVVTTVMVGNDPCQPAYDPESGEVFVPNSNSNNVSVISDTTNTVVATLPVGTAPESALYDNRTGRVYVSNLGSSNISIISGTSNQVVGAIPLGTQVSSLAYDYQTNEILAEGSYQLLAISPVTGQIVAAAPAQGSGDIAYAADRGTIYVTNWAGQVNILCDGTGESCAPQVESFLASPSSLYAGNTTWLNVSSTPAQGVLSYSYSGLPSGCVSANTSSLSCTPVVPGHFNVTVFVNDTNGNSAVDNVSLSVIPWLVALNISPYNPQIEMGESIDLAAVPEGGSGAYSFQWYSGAGCTTPLAGQTGATYDVTTPTASLVTSYQVWSSGPPAASRCSPPEAVSVNATLTVGALTPSSTTIDAGQWVDLAAPVQFGVPPYTVTWRQSATLPTANCNSTDSAMWTSSSPTWNFTNLPSGKDIFCITVTDRSVGTPAPILGSTWTQIAINPTFTLRAISPADPTVDRGQSINLSGLASGGTPGYSYQWFTGSSCSSPIPGATTANLTVTPTSTTSYSYDSNDSAAHPEWLCSPGDTVKVDGSLIAGGIAPSDPTIVAGRSVNLSTAASGGTKPYHYQWFIGAGCVSPISGATRSYVVVGPSVNTTYSYRINDSATTRDVACSPGDNVTVDPALSAGAIQPDSPTIDSGQSLVLDSFARGGLAPYSIQWYLGSSCSSPITGGVAPSLTVSPTLSTSYSYEVTDSESPAVSLCSPADMVSVDAGLAAGAPTTAQPVLDAGQSALVASSVSGGDGPFTFQWFSSSGSTSSCTSGSLLVGSTGSQLFVSPEVSAYYCYQVWDSSVGAPSASSASGWVFIEVSGPLRAGPISAARTVIDKGQPVVLHANPSGGALPYDVQWFEGADCASELSGANSSNLSVAPSMNTTYSYSVLDSASVPENQCSPLEVVTVNPLPSLSSPMATPDPLPFGSEVNISVVETGGTGPISYSFEGLPPGCASADNPSLHCVPSDSGNFTIIVYANDSVGESASTGMSLKVLLPPPEVVSSLTIAPSPMTLATNSTQAFFAVVGCAPAACPSSLELFWQVQSASSSSSGAWLQESTGTTTELETGPIAGSVVVALKAVLGGRAIGTSLLINITSPPPTQSSNPGSTSFSIRGPVGVSLVVLAIAGSMAILWMLLHRRRSRDEGGGRRHSPIDNEKIRPVDSVGKDALQRNHESSEVETSLASRSA